MLARSDWPHDYAEIFWEAYPRRVAKKEAMKALSAVRKANEVPFEILISAVRAFSRAMEGREMRFVPHPATWIRAGRWDDDLDALLGKSKVPVIHSVTPPMVIIRRFTAQAEAWERYRRAPIPWGRSSEWTVETEWPPK